MAPSRFVPLPHSLPPVHPHAIRDRETNANQPLEITLGVRRKSDLPRDLSEFDSVPPIYRRYRTHEELAAIYGSDPDAVARIEEFAATHQLKVTRNKQLAATLSLAGTVGNLTKAFGGVKLYDYHHPRARQFHAHTEPLRVPSDLKGRITGVFGFNTQRRVRRERPSAAETSDDSVVVRPRRWFWPRELGTIYNFPDVKRQTETIALLEFGGDVLWDDLTDYFRRTRTPPPDVRIIRVGHIPNQLRNDPNQIKEVMLDIEMVGALCPGARIAVYFSTFDEKGLIDSMSAVISDTVNKPSVVSISAGYSENQPFGRHRWSPPIIHHVDQIFLAAALLGITVCAATGDYGSDAGISDGRAHVWFPATSRYVLAVGGTTLRLKNGAGGRRVREVVWNRGPTSAAGGYPPYATGGGVSDITPRPAWQKGIVRKSINPGHFVGRGIPDVAANADRRTGYRLMIGGEFGVHGGTSAAAPLWASLIARLNCRLGVRVGNFNALLYSDYGPARILRDIKHGDNDASGNLKRQFQARKGWDAATGWGTPDGRKLLAALEQPLKTRRQPSGSRKTDRKSRESYAQIRRGRAQPKHH